MKILFKSFVFKCIAGGGRGSSLFTALPLKLLLVLQLRSCQKYETRNHTSIIYPSLLVWLFARAHIAEPSRPEDKAIDAHRRKTIMT